MHWLDRLGILSLLVVAACALWIVRDLRRRPQPMAIMNVVWPITALYLGPLAIFSYVRLGREPRSRTPRFWQQIVVEATHCGAGCTLGDVIAELTIALVGIELFGSHLFTEYAGDFILAYAFGVIFQYFAIAPMRGLSLWPGLRAAVEADTISLIAFEIGLFAWMFAMTRLPFALDPLRPGYWLLMQIGMAIGFVTSYPANWWLVRRGVKVPM
jgi:hypothetical protein